MHILSYFIFFYLSCIFFFHTLCGMYGETGENLTTNVFEIKNFSKSEIVDYLESEYFRMKE